MSQFAYWTTLSGIFVSATLSAATAVWVAESPNNDLNNPISWSTNAVPGSNDEAVFDSRLGIDMSPQEQSTTFSVGQIQFPHSASAFTFTFDNQGLQFNDTGITGNSTATTINATNINNNLTYQIRFAGTPLSTSGQAVLNASNSVRLTGSSEGVSTGEITGQFSSLSNFTMLDGGSCSVFNEGSDSSSGDGNNVAALINCRQISFEQNANCGSNNSLSASNTGIYTGNNSLNGNHVGSAQGRQFVCEGDFQAQDHFTFSVGNTGTNSSSGTGNNYVGSVNGAQAAFDGALTVGDNTTFTLTNTGTNSSSGTLADFVGYIIDQQFYVTEAFSAGDYFSITANNTGVDSSSGVGGHIVGEIDSSSGTSGNQVLFNTTCTIGNHANIAVGNSGTYAGSNTGRGPIVGSMNLSQAVFGDSFNADDYLTLVVTNTGHDSGHGIGNDVVGPVSIYQAQFNAGCHVGNHAVLNISNQANFTGSNSTLYNNVGAIGAGQLIVSGNFEAGDFLDFNILNSSYDSGSGFGGNFVGTIAGGKQAAFSGSTTLGNSASLQVTNHAINFGNYTNSTNVGTFLNNSCQLQFANQFQSGDNLRVAIQNTAIQVNALTGSSSYTGLISGSPQASQLQFDAGCNVGDSASFAASNIGVNIGSYAVPGSSVASLTSQQIYFGGNFISGNFLGIDAINVGTDVAVGPGGTAVGVIGNGSQVEFNGTCVVGDNANFSLTNNGTNSNTGTSSSIGVVSDSQLKMGEDFTAGKNLTITAVNSASNTGNINNSIGVVNNCQVLFESGCTFDDGALLSAFNTGTVINSQILFNQGFTLLNGKASIHAFNQGTLGAAGIYVQGDSIGGNVEVFLSNTSFIVNTDAPTFTIGGLDGDIASIAQSLPTLVIDTDSSTNASFAGVIQDYPSNVSTLIKQGPGIQTFSGINSYTGLTTVQEGTLVLTGSLAGDTLVNAAGILKGTGTVGGDLINLGTIAPGLSIGTMSVLGNFSNDSGNYDLEVNGKGQSDLISVGGTATLDGGTVFVSTTDGGYQFQTPYTILSAQTISGTFGQATPISPLLKGVLSYDTSHAYLTLQTSLVRAAKSHNQRVVAERLDGIVNPNPNQTFMLSNLVSLPIPAAGEALESFSGYQHTDDLWAAAILNRQFIRRLYDPLRCLVTTEPDCNCSLSGWKAWVDGGGGYASVQGNKNAHRFRINNGEITAGLQKTTSCHLTGGIAASYETNHFKYKHGGTGNSESGLVGLYGLYRPSCFYGLADLTYGFSKNKINRAIIVNPAVQLRVHSSPKISQFSFYGEAGFDFHVDSLLVQPFAGIETSKYCRRHVREKHAEGWGLAVYKKDCSITSSRLGLHVTSNKILCNVDLSADLAWNRLLSSSKNSIRGRFLEFGDDFSIKGINLARNSVDYAVTASTYPYDCLTAYVEVSGEAWDNAHAINILGGIELVW